MPVPALPWLSQRSLGGRNTPLRGHLPAAAPLIASARACLRRYILRQFLGELSPNKTWEGFIGGGICTVLFAFATPYIYTTMPFLICPPVHLNVFSFDTLSLTCEYPSIFSWQQYTLTWLPALTGGLVQHAPSIWLLPIQLHALALGTFASVVAPFGGFFASGIKRAYKLDDFASIIPGHGGVYDRVDCQLIMGLATQIYYATFIGPASLLPVTRLVEMAMLLPAEDQLALYHELRGALKMAGRLR
jgi:phosphatidate cytidylyltransferase